MQVHPRLPLSFLLGSERLPALPLGFFPPKVFLPIAHQPICTVWAAPQACCSQARACESGQLLAHPCCFFSDRISPGSAVAKDRVDMSWAQWPSTSHRCENRVLDLAQGFLYSSCASAAGASLDTRRPQLPPLLWGTCFWREGAWGWDSGFGVIWSHGNRPAAPHTWHPGACGHRRGSGNHARMLGQQELCPRAREGLCDPRPCVL